MAETLLSAFAAAVAAHGSETALIAGDGTRVSFTALDAASRALAAAWAGRGMGPGDRILIAMPIGPDLYASLAAIWRLGAVAVLPEPAMGLPGLRNAIASTRIKGLCAAGPYRVLRYILPGLWGKTLFHPGQTGGTAPPGTPGPDDLALISFTSGATGAPKAIPRSHAFLMAQRTAVAPILESDRAEVDLIAFPVFVLINLAAGRCSALPNWRMSRLDRVTPAALADWIAATKATRLLLPPALCETLAMARLPATVTTIFTGGGPVFPDLTARLKSATPGLRIISVYGSTEAEPIADLDTAAITKADLTAMQSGAGLLAGHPVCPLRIVDGEITVSGPHVNTGYLDPARDAETKIKDGDTIWHRTGDAGRLDPQGRLWLLGRHGAAVQTANGPLHPFAIETAARLWPGVTRAALVATRGAGILAVAGDAAYLGDWQTRAATFGISDVRHCDALPLDRRHRSKIDLPALRRKLGLQG